MRSVQVVAQLSAPAEGSKTVIQKAGKEEMPFPWSEKDPYKLPVAIEKVQRLLMTQGWEKPWVEQIVDRIMKGMLKTTEERAKGVIDKLSSVGLRQDEICNMASISVVLLGLNPDTRVQAVLDYLRQRGVPEGSLAEIAAKHPRIFEYKVRAESGVEWGGGELRQAAAGTTD